MLFMEIVIVKTKICTLTWKGWEVFFRELDVEYQIIIDRPPTLSSLPEFFQGSTEVLFSHLMDS